MWSRTPWNAAPETAVAPANPVTKATDARKVQSDDKFSFFSNNNAQPLFGTIGSLIIQSAGVLRRWVSFINPLFAGEETETQGKKVI